MTERNRPLLLVTTISGMVALSIIIFGVITNYTNQKPLMISFLDVGQGDAIFIEAPNGVQVLIDGGAPNGGVLKELQKVMNFFDYSIDVILATHPDADHIGGLPEVVDRYSVGYIIQNGDSSDTQIFKQLQNDIEVSKKKNNTVATTAKKNDVIVLDKDNNIFLFVLHPDGVYLDKDSNGNSIVLKLVYGESSVILTGDAPNNVEKMLMYKDGKHLKSSILKAGHHGSKTSSSSGFVGAVSPIFSIISAGKDNRYGHPHKEVLDRLISVSEVYKTYEDGEVSFLSNGHEFIKN